MHLKKILLPGVALILLAGAWRVAGVAGVALVLTGSVSWLLLHLTRIMRVLRRAAERPVGYVDSAAALNAALKPRVALLHVVAVTRALGERLSANDEQPEIYRWADADKAQVLCEFSEGKLVKWTFSAAPALDTATAASAS